MQYTILSVVRLLEVESIIKMKQEYIIWILEILNLENFCSQEEHIAQT